MKLEQLTPHQKSLICPSDRLALGLEQSAAQPLALEIEAGALPKSKRRAGLVLEPDEHDAVMSWAHLHGLFVLHAGTHQAVHDLPPGWPDFTLIYSSRACLVEMKVRPRWRMDQLRVLKALADQHTPVFISRDSVSTIDHFKAWLLLNFNWSPQ